MKRISTFAALFGILCSRLLRSHKAPKNARPSSDEQQLKTLSASGLMRKSGDTARWIPFFR